MIAIVISADRRVPVTSSTNHYRYPSFQGWQAAAMVLRCEVCGDMAANERRPITAQGHQSETTSAKRRSQVELGDDELEQVAAGGGRVDPGGANT
jgi:hypothetical protein